MDPTQNIQSLPYMAPTPEQKTEMLNALRGGDRQLPELGQMQQQMREIGQVPASELDRMRQQMGQMQQQLPASMQQMGQLGQAGQQQMPAPESMQMMQALMSRIPGGGQ